MKSVVVLTSPVETMKHPVDPPGAASANLLHDLGHVPDPESHSPPI